MGDHDKYVYVELIEHWYYVPPIADNFNSPYPDWTKINPGWEEIVPIGHNQFEWGTWTSDTYEDEFGIAECETESDSGMRKLQLRNAHWRGGWEYLDTICGPDPAKPIVAEGIISGTHIEQGDYTLSIYPYFEGCWPWRPDQHPENTMEMAWGYMHLSMWHPSPFVYITLPAVPIEEPWPELYPGKHWWDLVPPPGQIGIWFQLSGWMVEVCKYGGEPGWYQWATRIGTEVAGDVGHYYDLNYFGHWGPDQSVVIEREFSGHAFYYARGAKQRISKYLRTYTGSNEDWPWGFTSIYTEVCPCLREFAYCCPPEGWDGLCTRCGTKPNSECYEVYEGANDFWDTMAQTYHRLQFDGATFEFTEAYNTEYYGEQGSYQRCHPRYYYVQGGRMFTGGWMIGDPGSPRSAYYYSFIKDMGHEYVRIPCELYSDQGHALTYQPFPGMDGIYHNGTTRLMMRQQEVNEFVGPLYQERFGPEALIQ